MTTSTSPVAAGSVGAPGPRSAIGPKLFSVVAAVVGATAAMFSGFAWASGDKTRIILPLAVLGAMVFGALALTRFAAFVSSKHCWDPGQPACFEVGW